MAACIVHTDRGSQFRSHKHMRALNLHGMVGSMGRVVVAGDHTAMESFFALLQTMSWLGAPGPRAKNYASRSSPGSNAPTTTTGKMPSADYPPSNSTPK